MRERGIELESIDHATLPYMGESGCIVEPQHRPLCTLHTCAISAFGYKSFDTEWNNKYWKIRDSIDEVEHTIMNHDEA